MPLYYRRMSNLREMMILESDPAIDIRHLSCEEEHDALVENLLYAHDETDPPFNFLKWLIFFKAIDICCLGTCITCYARDELAWCGDCARDGFCDFKCEEKITQIRAIAEYYSSFY